MPLPRDRPQLPPSPPVWAFAKLQHYQGGLMRTIATEARLRIGEFSQQNLGERPSDSHANCYI